MTFKECLERTITIHPQLDAADIIKFTFQATFGAEHLISDLDKATEYFVMEYEEVKPKDEPLYEYLNEKYMRVNMAAWKYKGLDSKALLSAFLESASRASSSKESDFLNNLIIAGDILRNSGVQIPEFNDKVNEYIKNGISQVHHSEIYKKAYNPAYRVVEISGMRIS